MKYNPFKVNKDLTSYTYPVIKMILFPILFYLILDTELRIIYFAILLYCFVIADQEIEEISDKRELERQPSRPKKIMLSTLKRVLLREDILDLVIEYNGERLKIGAASDSERNGKFFDKVYYIKDQEYQDINEFLEEVEKYSNNRQFKVILVDGLDLKYYSFSPQSHD